MTNSMEIAISETKRRRAIQEAYNIEHGITPKTIQKDIRDVIRATQAAEAGEEERTAKQYENLSKKDRQQVIARMEKEMKDAARALDFERAAELRDLILELKVEG